MPFIVNRNPTAFFSILCLPQHTKMLPSFLFGVATFGAAASAYSLPANLKTIYNNHKVNKVIK